MRTCGPTARCGAGAALALLLVAAPALAQRATPPAPPQRVAGTYFDFELYATQHAEGAGAQVKMRLAPSPFEIPVTVEGHVLYEVQVSARGLRDAGPAVYIAWAAPPSLDRFERIGELSADLTVTGRVHFNKFLIFITRSADAATQAPLRDPIVLRGTSRSGRIRSIFDHTDIVGGS
jgi:hypothetical protein